MEDIKQIISKMKEKVKNLTNEELVKTLSDPSCSEVAKMVSEEVLNRLDHKPSHLRIIPEIQKPLIAMETVQPIVQPNKPLSLFDDKSERKYGRQMAKQNELCEMSVLVFEGEKYSDIAMVYNVNQTLISKLVSGELKDKLEPNFNWKTYRKNIKLISSVKRLSKEDRDTIKFLLQQNVSENVIATKFHVPLLSVALMLSYLSGRRSYKQRQNAKIINRIVSKNRTNLSNKEVDEIREFIRNGESIADIAKCYNVCDQTVRNVVKYKTHRA